MAILTTKVLAGDGQTPTDTPGVRPGAIMGLMGVVIRLIWVSGGLIYRKTPSNHGKLV